METTQMFIRIGWILSLGLSLLFLLSLSMYVHTYTHTHFCLMQGHSLTYFLPTQEI